MNIFPPLSDSIRFADYLLLFGYNILMNGPKLIPLACRIKLMIGKKFHLNFYKIFNALRKNIYTLWGRKLFLLPVTYFPTNLVFLL